MAVIHDFECPKHGVFEGTHAICPHLGCDSAKVKMVFLKAPGLLSAGTRNFDRGIKQTATQMNLPNLRSAQEGDTAYGGHHAGKMLWGQEGMQHFGGAEAMAAASHTSIAQTNAYVDALNKADKSKQRPHVADGMRSTATDQGLTQRVLPPAERIYHREDGHQKASKRK